MAAARHRNASKPGQVLALTLRYQHSHPEHKTAKKIYLGRIDLSERYHYTRGVARIFIKNKKLLNIVMSKRRVDEAERAREIKNYFLRKHNGDREKAKAEIHEYVEALHSSHAGAHFRDEAYMRHLAETEGIPEKDVKDYVEHSGHMAAAALTLLWSYFQEAELII